MLMLSARAIVIGIVVCMLTGMPRSMIRKNLYKRGKFGDNPDQLIAEAETQIRNMLTWHTISEEDVIEVFDEVGT